MLPTICWLCHVPDDLTSGLCPTCFGDLPRIQPEPFLPRIAMSESVSVRYWAAPLYYTGSVVRWVQQYKFARQTGLASFMAPLIVAHMIKLYQQHQTYLPQALIPVPLSNSRWMSRGFNQAELLAKHIGVLFGIPVINAVHRARRTKQSYRLGVRARSSNLQHAFLCSTPDSLAGYKRVAIVDDLVTTGATASNVADVLKQGVMQRGVQGGRQGRMHRDTQGTNQGRVVIDVWALGFTPAPNQDDAA